VVIRTEVARNAQAAPVETFLKRTLAGGAISVPEHEECARSAGLLGEHQQIGDAKKFRGAKKRLGITSRRDGFGRGGGRRRDALEQLGGEVQNVLFLFTDKYIVRLDHPCDGLAVPNTPAESTHKCQNGTIRGCLPGEGVPR
jgi:hypothetical protein